MFLKKPKFWDNKGYNFISVFLLPFTLITSLINWTKIFHEKKNHLCRNLGLGEEHVKKQAVQEQNYVVNYYND